MLETVYEKMSSGGVIMIPIIILSVTLWILIIERLMFLRDERRSPENLSDVLLPCFIAEDWQRIEAVLSNSKGAVARAFHRASHERPRSFGQLISALEHGAREEYYSVERFLPAISVLVIIAPLLGLLGTVFGMITTFDVITSYGAGEPKALAAGISQALITTEAGLLVAIPGLLVFGYLANLSGRAVMRLEQLSSRIAKMQNGVQHKP